MDIQITTTALDQDAAELFRMTQSSRLWPEHQRTIYCSVTGAPWGTVNEEYVRHCCEHYSEADIRLAIDRVVFMSGPSPMWSTKTPTMLSRNQEADPAGFLVYQLNWVLKLEEAAREAAKGDIEVYFKWRRGMVELYAKLRQVDKALLFQVNETLLVMTGEGLYPAKHMFPALDLPPYGDVATLQKLREICHKYYKQYKGRYKLLPGGVAPGITRHEIHSRTFMRSYSMDTANTKMQYDFVSMKLADLFADLDAKEPKAAHKAAKQSTGIASATFAMLKEMENDMPIVRKTQFRLSTGGAPVKLNFGKKKDA